MKFQVGMKIGKLTILECHDGFYKHYTCKCDCGNKVPIGARDLERGVKTACHVCNPTPFRINGKTHGESGTRLWNIWVGMRQRCNNRNYHGFHRYGGRGIKVCEEWNHDYTAFRDWATSHGYKDNLSIDRIDNDGNYCPENCQWITISENSAKVAADRRKREPPKCAEMKLKYTGLRNYTFHLPLTRDENDLIKTHAEAKGENISKFIRRAILEQIERDMAIDKTK